jgi:hypothetical protein
MTRKTPTVQPRSEAYGPTAPSVKPPLSTKLMTILGLGAVLSILIIPAVLDQQTQRVIGFRANDRSQSGLPYSAVAQQHCQAQIRQLKPGDWVVNIDYADRPEVIQDTLVHSQVELLRQCQDDSHPTPIAAEMGIDRGTSPHLLLDQILIMIRAKRAEGITAPAVVTVWLQAAEPVPGQLAFDITHIKSQAQQITDAQGVIALMGTTGQLQTDLRTALADNPSARVCTLNDIDDCINWAYRAGRQRSPLL